MAEKKLKYSFGNQMVWLVWELQAGKPSLALICTTDEDLARYVTDDRRRWHGTEQPVFCETRALDHRFGFEDRERAIAANLIRRSA